MVVCVGQTAIFFGLLFKVLGNRRQLKAVEGG